MKAYVLTIENNSRSNMLADRCVLTAKKYRVNSIEKFNFIETSKAYKELGDKKLSWTWADNNTRAIYHSQTNLKMNPLPTDLRDLIARSLTHYQLWEKCVNENQPILIVDYDTTFINKIPSNFKFSGLCQIIDPNDNMTQNGDTWSQKIKSYNKQGTYPKIKRFKETPDGFAKKSGYILKPWAAKQLIKQCHKTGLWPHDLFLCSQLFPFIEECYPFIVKSNHNKNK